MISCLLCIFSLLLAVMAVDTIAANAGTETHLPICPPSPNCVSSQEDDKHFIQPFSVAGDAHEAFSKLIELLEKRKDTTILPATEDKKIHVEFRTTLLKYVDDGFFVLDGKNKVIDVYSASRLGYWDFGKNRSRLEEIRQEFQNCTVGSEK